MRIRAIDIKNWACIDALTLADLSDGIVVLHGPNQTGKSSLADALRCCLFDLDHNSGGQRLSAVIPRRTRAVPEVTIELEIAGEHFQVAKAFSRNKEGFARLKQRRGDRWNTIEEGKQANQKIRELVGAEKSTSGLFQLLWLPQGEVRLPDTPDPALEKSLEGVLGSMITGRDLDFKNRLDKACERWFTPTMQDKKSSCVLELTTVLKQAEDRKAEIERDWKEAEAALQQYEAALARAPELQRSLSEAEMELKTVAQERDTIAVRASQYEIAVKHRDAEKRHREQAEQNLRDWDQAEAKRLGVEKDLQDTQQQVLAAADRVSTAQTAEQAATQAFDNAERALAEHQRTRAALDDRRQLLTLAVQGQALDPNIEQVQGWLSAIADIETKLTGPPVLTREQIDALRQNQTAATKLRAQLEAGEIQIIVHAATPLDAAISLDGGPAWNVTLPADGEQRCRARQDAELTFGNGATIRIGRTQENRDLEQMAERLADLEAEYRQTLNVAQVDPTLATALDALVVRRLERETHIQELNRLRGSVAKAAPDGLPALQAQRKHLRDREEATIARRPDLHAWSPNQHEVDQLQGKFEARSRDLNADLEQARASLDRSRKLVGSEQIAHQTVRDRAATLTVEFQNLEAALRKKDRALLEFELAEAEKRLAEAETTVQETTLNDAERAVESCYQAALNARNQRAARQRDNENLLLELRTKLTGTEGLHPKRIQAEQAVNDLTRELKRETLYAHAHKHLKELFEQVRNEQVRRTVGPINDRVTSWAEALGLGGYSGLAFGDQLLPGGLVLDGESVEIARESYGTQEQLSILIRLAVGGLLAVKESAVAILDDPLAHADDGKHRRMLDILTRAARGEPHGPHPTGPLQLIILTCHADRFDYLADAQQIDLARLIRRGG